jgi:hypothetical protein
VVTKPKPHTFGRFDVRRIRVVGGWALPANRDGQVLWKDRTEGDGEPLPRPWPEARKAKEQR